jgi:hypothetical protein
MLRRGGGGETNLSCRSGRKKHSRNLWSNHKAMHGFPLFDMSGTTGARRLIHVLCRERVGGHPRVAVRVMLASSVESAPSRCFRKRSSACARDWFQGYLIRGQGSQGCSLLPVAFDQRRGNVLPSMHISHGHRCAAPRFACTSRPARL